MQKIFSLPLHNVLSFVSDLCSRHIDCHENAKCVVDERENRYRCNCNEYYEGDGFTCTPASSKCLEIKRGLERYYGLDAAIANWPVVVVPLAEWLHLTAEDPGSKPLIVNLIQQTFTLPVEENKKLGEKEAGCLSQSVILKQIFFQTPAATSRRIATSTPPATSTRSA